jgi:hypothetical protein
MKTTISDGNHLVFISGIAITPSLEGEEDKWLRDILYIDDIGPEWLVAPTPNNIVAMAFLNSIYQGDLDKKDKQKGAGWAIDEIIGTDIKNQRINLKLRVAVYHPRVRLLRIGFSITAVGKLLNECENLIVDNILPAENSNMVSKNSPVIIIFNMPIDESSCNSSTFKLVKENSEQPINGKIQKLNDKTFVLVPQDVLESNTKYVVTISKEIQSMQGLGLKNEKKWSFITSK